MLKLINCTVFIGFLKEIQKETKIYKIYFDENCILYENKNILREY